MDASILAGKRALITGGAGSVGRSVAAPDGGCEAKALITDRNEADLRSVVAATRDVIEAVEADLSAGAW